MTDEFGPEYARELKDWTLPNGTPGPKGWAIVQDSKLLPNVVALLSNSDNEPMVFDTKRDCELVIAMRRHLLAVCTIRNVLERSWRHD